MKRILKESRKSEAGSLEFLKQIVNSKWLNSKWLLAICLLLFAFCLFFPAKKASSQTQLRWEQIKPISAQLEKTTPVANDLILIEDSADGQKKKYIKWSKFTGALSGIRDTLEFHRDSLRLAFDSIEAHNQRLIALESGGSSINSYKLNEGIVTGRNINITLIDYTPDDNDILSVVADSEIPNGDTLTLSINGGTQYKIFETNSYSDTTLAMFLMFRDNYWYLITSIGEESVLMGKNYGDQNIHIDSTLTQYIVWVDRGDTIQIPKSSGVGLETDPIYAADSTAIMDSLDVHNQRLIDLEIATDSDSQNLTYSSYSDKGIMNISGGTGDTIPAVTSTKAGLMLPEDKLKLQNDILTVSSGSGTSYNIIYGALYNNYVTEDSRKISSSDTWTVPTEANMETLLNYIGDYNSGDGMWYNTGELKETGTTHWYSQSSGTTNTTNFSMRGSGRRTESSFAVLTYRGYLWSDSQSSVGTPNQSWMYKFEYNNEIVEMLDHLNYYAASIRLRRAATTEEQALPDGTYLENYVGNNQISYPTVKIGTQVFTAVNLAETKWRNGTWIAGYDDGVYTPISNENWALLSTSALCFYSDEVASYGEIVSATKGFGIGDTIYFDATLKGNGTASNPIGINKDSLLVEETDPVYAADSTAIKDTLDVHNQRLIDFSIGLSGKEPANSNIQAHISGDSDLSATNEIQNLQQVVDAGNVVIDTITSTLDSTYLFAKTNFVLSNGLANNKAYSQHHRFSFTGTTAQNRIVGANYVINNFGTGTLSWLGGTPVTVNTLSTSTTTNIHGMPVAVNNYGKFNKMLGHGSWLYNYSNDVANNDGYGFYNQFNNSGVLNGYVGYQTDIYNTGAVDYMQGMAIGIHSDGGTMTNMVGLNLGYNFDSGHNWTGTPINSYGILIDRSIDRGSSLRYSILSESRSLNRLYGNFQLDTLKGTGNRFAMVDANGLFSATKKDSISYWNDAYANKIVSAAFSGTSTKTLTLTQQDGGTVTANFDDNTGNGMVYPGSGIAVSTGSAWGTSITDNSTNWNTAYSNRIATFTTTGSSGAATFSGNTLNIPNYTLSGLGGQPALSGTGFVKISGTTISYDNSTYLTSESDGSVTNEIQTVDTFRINSNTLELSLSSDGQAKKTVSLSPYLDNTDAQTLAIDSSGTTRGITISGGNRIHFSVGGGVGGGVNSYTMLSGSVNDKNINVNLTDYTPVEGDIISVIPDDDIATGDTITFSVNGGTAKDILGYTSHDSQYSLELVYLTDAWGLLGKKAEEYAVKGINTGDQDLSGMRDSIADIDTSYINKDGSVAFTGIVSYNAAKTFTTDNQLVSKKYVDDAVVAGGGYTDEQAQDAVGAMVTGNTETYISVTYDDATNKLNFAVDLNSAVEVVDIAYNATNFDGHTQYATSQDDFYDYNHIADTDDDGLPNKVDLGSAGFVKSDASGNLSVDGNTYLTTEIDGSLTNEIEVVDEVYNSTNFNGSTTQGTSQDDFYDFNHIADTDDDGLANKVDLASAGFVKTDASGNLSVDATTYGNMSTSTYDSNVDNKIDVAAGGTGLAAMDNYKLFIGTGGNYFGQLATGTAGQLLVSGGTSANPAFSSIGSTGQVIYNSSGSLTSSSAFTFNGTDVASTGTFTGTNFILSSDRRLKEHIKRLSNLLWIDSIQFNQFNFKTDEQKRLRYGVIAQEVEKVQPNLVYTDNDGIKSVSYIDLLIAKVARQDEIIQQLLERIEKLESENNKSSQEYLIDVNVKGSTINTFNNEK